MPSIRMAGRQLRPLHLQTDLLQVLQARHQTENLALMMSCPAHKMPVAAVVRLELLVSHQMLLYC